MTDIMKLADDYAEKADAWNCGELNPQIVDKYRAALQSAIEALAAENERLKRELEISKLDAKEWYSQADALQAKLDAMGKGEPVAPEQVEAAWRAGWAACRDAEYVGQEAEDEAWGMSQTCANADWESAAPKALAPEQVEAAQAQVGENYGVVTGFTEEGLALVDYPCEGNTISLEEGTLLYAAPKALAPLTDEQIEQAVKTYGVSWTGYREDDHGFYTIPVLSPYHYQFARAIEAAHGIGGTP